jgi:hypothetical protein
MGLVMVTVEQVMENACTIVSTTSSLSLLARLQHQDECCLDEQFVGNFPFSQWKSWQWWRRNGISPLLPTFLGERKTFWPRSWTFVGRVHKDGEVVRMASPLYYIDKKITGKVRQHG